MLACFEGFVKGNRLIFDRKLGGKKRSTDSPQRPQRPPPPLRSGQGQRRTINQIRQQGQSPILRSWMEGVSGVSRGDAHVRHSLGDVGCVARYGGAILSISWILEEKEIITASCPRKFSGTEKRPLKSYLTDQISVLTIFSVLIEQIDQLYL